MSIYDIEVKTETGQPYHLSEYKGKVLLIVNTASKCGLTPQFDGLEQLYKKFKDQDFVVLGFPSNQFKQEVATAEEATSQCRLNYGVTFPMHEITTINGNDTHPLFKYLKNEAKGLLGSSIKWNFTKFLVDRDGNVIERFGPTDTPASFEDKIKAIL